MQVVLSMEAETLGARFFALGFSFEWTENFIRTHDHDEAEVELAHYSFDLVQFNTRCSGGTCDMLRTSGLRLFGLACG